MCEDRSLRTKRGDGSAGRIRNLRMRARMMLIAERVQDDSISSSEAGAPHRLPPAAVPTAQQPANSAPAAPQSRGEFVQLCQGDCCREIRERIRERRQGLVDIARRTMILMQNNRQLQKQLKMLQEETKEFVDSVMTLQQQRIHAVHTLPQSQYQNVRPRNNNDDNSSN